MKYLKHFTCPKCKCLLYMKLYLGSEPQYDRFCKECNIMYKSMWDKIHHSNWKSYSYQERKRLEDEYMRSHGGRLSIFAINNGNYLKSFEESGRKYKPQIVFAKKYQMDFKLAMSPRRIEKWLKTPTKIVYQPVPPLKEPAIKIPRKFHEEFLEFRKKLGYKD